MDPDTRDGGGKRVRWKYGEVRVMAVVAVLAVVLLLVFLAMAFSSLRRLQEVNLRVRGSWALMFRTEQLYADAIEAHGAMQNYLNSGDSTLLDVRDRDLERIARTTHRLDSLLDGREAEAELHELGAAMDSLRALWQDQEHTLERDSVLTAEQQRLFALRSRRAFARLRAQQVVLQSNNSIALSQTSDRERRWASVPPMVFLAFAVLAMAVLTLLLLRTLRALTRARQAEGRALTLLEERDRESRIRAEAEQRVKQVVEAARNGILLLSARRGSDGDVAGLEVVLANASAARIANTDRDRLVGGLLRDVLPALAVPALRAQWLHVLEEGYTSIAEVQADLGTGPGRYELRAERVQDGLLLTIRDLDEPGRRGPEEGSEKRLAGIGRFARVFAHEVRNPLTNIHLALEQLQAEIPADAAEGTGPYTAILKRNAKRIGDHVTQLIQASRPLSIELVPSSLPPVLEEVLEQVRDRSKLLRMRVDLEVEDRLPPLPMDAQTLTIALVNLCVNALEAMEEGKGELRLRAYQEEGTLLIEVADNGKGMSPEEQERIFQPFYSGREGGLGLGLSEARNILEAHHAGISLRSRPAGGTSVLLSFPLVP